MINDIGDDLPTAVGRSLFVDDLAVWYSASSARLVSRQLQLAVSRLERWSAENGLRFSTMKTVAVHFCRRRCPDPDLGIRLYRQSIPTKPSAKFLGVVFDRRLTYREHFKVLRERCFKSLNVFKCVSRTSYGADRSTLLLLCLAISLYFLDQGLPAVHPAESLASEEPRLKSHGLSKAGEAGVPRCKDPRSRPPEGASEALLGPDLPAPGG